MKALEVRPLGASGLDNLPVYNIGQSGDTKWWVDVFPEEIQSKTVAPDDWGAEDATTIGHEPAAEGEPAGPKTQTGMRFRETKHYTPWYGFGASTDRTPASEAYHPSQLLRVVFKGTPGADRARSDRDGGPGDEAGGHLPPRRDEMPTSMIYAGGRGLIRGLSRRRQR
jgi:hypothetical protein